MKQKPITPVFIIGAARNGTTSLTNVISSFPEFAEIEHELHRGNHEAKIYSSYKFYGDISKPDKYIDFLFHYSSGDYFHLSKGDIEYHLQNPKKNFFEFYCDLMDNYCLTYNKKFWLAKLDTSFFTDEKTWHLFNNILQKKYKQIKYIQIKRNFEDALLSSIYMPGKNFSKSKNGIQKTISLLNYTQQWFKTYILKHKYITNEALLQIDFGELVNDKNKVIFRIREFLNLPLEFKPIKSKNYSVNTSFSKIEKPKLNSIDLFLSKTYLKILKKIPILPSFIQKLYSDKKRNSIKPISRRILKYNYFKHALKDELQRYGSFGLAEKIENELKDTKKLH